MDFKPLEIPGVIYITPQLYKDDRGYFFESYHMQKFIQHGITMPFVQDNQSRSQKGTLRGLHYQIEPFAQAKLVRVLSGEIWDVAVDIRQNSATFGKWVARHLSAERHDMLFIPAGFAHGFYVISDTADVLYKCSHFYTPQAERSLKWNDPKLQIAWPIDTTVPLFISPKDEQAPAFLNH